MIRTVNWEKKTPQRYTQRRLVEYILKENNIEIGYFQIKGLLNQEILGELFTKKIELKNKIQSNSKWFFPSTYTLLLDCVTKDYLAKITGSTAISYLKKIIYKREITTKEEKKYVFQMSIKEGVNVFEDTTSLSIIHCNNPKSQNGAFTFIDGTDETILLATFYILHQFMELNESTS